MKTLRRGDSGPEVRRVQVLLGITADGIFGTQTEQSVEDFQESVGILVDGIVGRVTWSYLEKSETITAPECRKDVVRVNIARKYNGQGYESFRLRDDVALALVNVNDVVRDHGGYLTSSGGLRGLHARVNANRSATSMHYVGRALDLFVYSAMVDPHNDPFVCTVDPGDDRKFIVWARCPQGYPMKLDGVTYEKADKSTGYPQVVVPTEGTFINLTELMRQEGFEPISARRSFFRWGRKNNGGAEWWHFQYEEGLEKGVTTFGEELLKIYPESKLKGTPPWRYRHYVFGVDWF